MGVSAQKSNDNYFECYKFVKEWINIIEGKVILNKLAPALVQIHFIFRGFSFIPYARLKQEIIVPFVRSENSFPSQSAVSDCQTPSTKRITLSAM